MKLLELTTKGFGRLRNAHFVFHPKINIIFGPNEAGKSTLQQAIIALLYGYYDSHRAHPRERELHEQYRPWTRPLPESASHALAQSSLRSAQISIPVSHGPAALATQSHLVFGSTENNTFALEEPSVDVVETAVLEVPAHGINLSSERSISGIPRFPAGIEYSGNLKYILDDGKILLIHRDFSSDDMPTQLLDAITGEDWLARYSRGRHGKTNFMEKQIGMSRQVFLATACIQQGALRPLAERDASAVSEAILHLLDTASAENSAERAIERLEKKLRELGSDRSQKALLPQARARLEDLHETHALRVATQRAVQDDLEKAEILEWEIDELRDQLAMLDRQILETQLLQLESRLNRWQENQREREKLANEIATLLSYQNFPVEDKERFFQLRHDYTHLEKLRALLTDEHNTLDLRLMALTEKSKTLQVPEQTWTEYSFEDFLALRSRWESTFHAILDTENARHDADQALQKAGLDEAERAALAGLDWAQLEQHKALEARAKEGEAEVEVARQEYNRFQLTSQRQRRLAALVAIVASVVLTYAVLNNLFGNKGTAGFWENISLTLSLAGLAVFIWLNVRWVIRSRELGAQLLQIEDSYMEDRQQLREIQFRYHVKSIDELMQRRLQFVELGSVLEKHQQLAQEMKKIEQALTPWMMTLGIGHIAPETLQSAEKRLRESHQLWSEKTMAQQRLTQIDEQQREIDKNLQQQARELETLLQKAGIQEPVGEKAFQIFLSGCQKREYSETLQLQWQHTEALAKEILAGETPEALAANVKQMRDELEALTAAQNITAVSPASLGAERTAAKASLPSEVSLAELRELREAFQQEKHGKEETVAAVRERVATRLQGVPPLAEIEEEIALVEAEVQRLEHSREALEVARDSIAQVAQRLHHDFAPRLNNFLVKYLDKLTGGRYIGAMVDPADFSVRLQSAEISAPIELSRLSFGTVEQVYLLLRAAVVEFFAENGESVPLLLDDPLVHADSKRMANALQIIDALADSHQILYFTKDPQVLDYFRKKAEKSTIINLQIET